MPRFRAALRAFLSSYLICRIIKKIKIFLPVFFRRIFSMREPRPDWARPALAYIKKHPAGSEPAGLYKINRRSRWSPRHAVDAPPRIINMKKNINCGSREKFFLCFISRFRNLLCVAVRVVSCCLCNGAVVSYGGNCTAPLHI